MSFEIPEQAKYRLTGGIILILIAVVVMPNLMRKSNQRFEENLSMHLQVPPRPASPSLNIPTAQQVFKKIKPVEVDAPKVAKREVQMNLDKAHHLNYASYVSHIPEPVEITPKAQMVKSEPEVQKKNIVFTPEVKIEVRPKKLVPTKQNEGNKLYAVQLASFSHLENANFLIKRLKKLGYTAQSSQLSGKSGPIYQVSVGKLSDRQKAIALQKQLAQNLQIEGLIITKG
jgi:DedD protein